MGERKMKIVDVARETGLHRNTITLLYRKTAAGIELEAMDRLCRLFGCGVEDLFEFVPEVRIHERSRWFGRPLTRGRLCLSSRALPV